LDKFYAEEGFVDGEGDSDDFWEFEVCR
jgi:hypothetical protein